MYLFLLNGVKNVCKMSNYFLPFCTKGNFEGEVLLLLDDGQKGVL